MGRDTGGLVQIMVQAKAADSNAEIVGSPQESDEVCILSGLLKRNEFGLGNGQSLCFE